MLASRHSRENAPLAPLKVRTSPRVSLIPKTDSGTLHAIISFVAAVGAFLFVTLSLGALAYIFFRCVCIDDDLTASGLLWLSELIEEHSKFAKVVGKRCIYVRLSQKSRPCARSVNNITPTGHHINTRLIGIHRFLAPSQDRVLHTLSRYIPAKFL